MAKVTCDAMMVFSLQCMPYLKAEGDYLKGDLMQSLLAWPLCQISGQPNNTFSLPPLSFFESL